MILLSRFRDYLRKWNPLRALLKWFWGETMRVKIRIKLLRREGDDPGGGKDIKSTSGGSNIYSEEGGGEKKKEKKIEGTKVEVNKSGSKMQTSWKIVKAKMLQM